jgi:hypothetical protein
VIRLVAARKNAEGHVVECRDVTLIS